MSSIYHEARKREKATQKLFSDHKKWVEKKREENRVDPATLLQVNGLKAEILVDSNVYKQADKSLVAWQGDPSIKIDRFDVRATISSLPGGVSRKPSSGSRNQTVLDSEESEPFKKLLNYERYRLLIQNEINDIPEETRLRLVRHTVALSSEAKIKKLRNNKFGTSGEANIGPNTNISHNTIETKRPSAAIPFNYGTSDNHSPINEPITNIEDIDDIAADLDTIEVPTEDDCKKLADISRNYGLSIEQFKRMAKDDSASKMETKDILLMLGSGDISKSTVDSVEPAEPYDDTYGPELPPELQAVSSRVSTASSSPISELSDEKSDGKIFILESQNPSVIPFPSSDVQNSIHERAEISCPVAEAVTEAKQESKPDPERRRAPTPLVYRLERLSPHENRDRPSSHRRNRSSRDRRRFSSRSSDSPKQRHPSISSHTSSDSDPYYTAKRATFRKRRSKKTHRSRSRSLSRQRDRHRNRRRPHTSKSRSRSSRVNNRRD